MDCRDIYAPTCADVRFVPMDGPRKRWFHKNYPRGVHRDGCALSPTGDCWVGEMDEPSMYSDLPRSAFLAVSIVDAPHRIGLHAMLPVTIRRLCTVGAQEKTPDSIKWARRAYEWARQERGDPQARDDYDQGI